MLKNVDHTIAKSVLKIRCLQILFNEYTKKDPLVTSPHLAMGHESIAVALNAVKKPGDILCLSHRNGHYNLATGADPRAVFNEYRLRSDGLMAGQGGSMNLRNEQGGVAYTSSILGNNLPVATGMSLAQKVRGENNVTIVVTGDGAMEEGAFYESLVFMQSQELSAIIIVENNGWAMSTSIDQRRGPIDLSSLAEGCGANYANLTGNDPYRYIEELASIRLQSLEESIPVVVEVELKTLGEWIFTNDESPDGVLVNYHAGAAPTVSLDQWPFVLETDDDPAYVVSRYFDQAEFKTQTESILSETKKAIT